MYIQEFIERRMQSPQFSILYDKSERNTLDLQTKEKDALVQLVKEINLNFAVQVSVESVRKVVDNILNTAKNLNLNDRLQQSSSTDVCDENNIAATLEKLNECLDEESSIIEKENPCDFYKPFVKHRNTMSTKLHHKHNSRKQNFSDKNPVELKNLGKKVKKMEQSFNESCKILIEAQIKNDSSTFSLVLEYFLNVDPAKMEECTQEVLDDITEWFE